MCDGEFPLSFAQQRLWFIDQLEPGGSLYNLPAALRLKGKLDVSALEHALDEVVRRHESLRTTFPSRGGCPVQLISPTSGLRLRVRDLTALPADERENEAQRLAAEESKAPFDLVSGPLVRALLVKLSEEEHVALCTMHHIISDWWSVGVFIRELTVFYQAHIQGRESPLPELLIQYADYAAWEQQHISGEALEEKLSYWKEALAGAPALLKLPTDRARPAMPSYCGARQVFSVPEEVCRMLCELSRREGATLFTTLLAAFGALLSRYSGQEDVLVGTEVANRTRHEVEGVIGPFVNRLLLRVRMPAGGTFSDLLRAVRGVTLDAYAHHDVPYGQVVAALQPESVSGQAPLFHVVFVLQSPPTESIDLPDLRLDSLEMGGGTVEFDLKLTVVEAGRGLTGTFEYSTDLFDAPTIERMSGDFNALLAEVAEESSRRVGDLRPLSGQEQRGMLPEGNEQMLAAPTCNETGNIKHHWQEVHEKCQTCDGSGYVDLFESDRCVVCKGKTSTVRYECRICHHRLESIDVERLLTGLGSDNAHEQEAARGELIESGDLVVDLLLTSLSEGPVTSRVRAAKALGAIGNVRAVEPLLTASRYDSSRWVRETARRSLGMIRGDEGMGARGRRSHSPSPLAAANALGEIGDTRAVSQLIASLKDNSKRVRTEAARALTSIGVPEAAAPLAALLNDQDTYVRRAAAKALTKLGNSTVVEPLIASLSDDDRDVRLMAAEALRGIGDVRATAPLIASLRDNVQGVRLMAAEALTKIGAGIAVEPILALLDGCDDVRVFHFVQLCLMGISLKEPDAVMNGIENLRRKREAELQLITKLVWEDEWETKKRIIKMLRYIFIEISGDEFGKNDEENASITSAIRSTFNIDISLRDLHRYSDLGELAHYINITRRGELRGRLPVSYVDIFLDKF